MKAVPHKTISDAMAVLSDTDGPRAFRLPEAERQRLAGERVGRSSRTIRRWRARWRAQSPTHEGVQHG